MEAPALKIEGIYNQETLKFLAERGLHDFGFDFSPLSLNFLQQHVFIDMLKSCFSTKHRYFLRYSGESDTGINKMIHDLKDLYGGNCFEDNFILEFADSKDREFYDQFNSCYYWHYYSNAPIEKMLESPLLGGLILDNDLLENLQTSGHLFIFMQNVFTLISKRSATMPEIKIILRMNWDSVAIGSLFDFFKFDLFSYGVNAQVEKSYRQVDNRLLAEQVGFLRTQIHNMFLKAGNGSSASS